MEEAPGSHKGTHGKRAGWRTYIGYIGPREQAGPPFYVEEVTDPDLEPGPESAAEPAPED